MKREPVHERLDRVRGLLAARPSWTARELAAELGVNLRTVRRDLARLCAQGVPVESTTGRGGGVRLPPRSGIGGVQRDVHEALDLVLSLALAESLRSPLFFSTVGRLRHKIGAAFPPDERARLGALRRRIQIGPTSPSIAASWSRPRSEVLRPVHEAFFEQRSLEVDYAAGDARTRRTVEPHYVLLSWPAWYLVVWDHLRSAVRALRVDRIERATVLNARFRLRPSEEMLASVRDRFAAL